MSHALILLALFAAKSIIILAIILMVLIAFFALLAKGKDKTKSKLVIKNLNKHYAETSESLLSEVFSKKQFKQYLKEKKAAEKSQQKEEQHKNIFVLNFNGDMKASAVSALREEVTAILNIVKPNDEVVVKIESAGGVVHGYGLGAAQLMRIRKRNIPLTVTIDKIAASGGYMMACIANKILAAPFAIVGSIGVIVQLPNFHRVLKDNHIDFEQHMAGEFKRTITVFGENTKEGRDKLQHDIEDIHQLFKSLIQEHRKDINIQQVATGEHWMGQQAIGLKLVDEIKTSDDYLLERSKEANIFEISYEVKKPFLAKLMGTANMLREKIFASWKLN